jgi:hypothetical protein
VYFQQFPRSYMKKIIFTEPPNQSGFKNETEILKLVPVSRRTLSNWKARGWVPFIKIGRRCLYDWPSVAEALRRRQQGGMIE